MSRLEQRSGLRLAATLLAAGLVACVRPPAVGDANGFSSNLAIMVVDTGAAELGRDTVRGTASLYLPGADGRTRLDDASAERWPIDVRHHGSSSLAFPKKKLVFWSIDAAGGRESRAIAGLPAGAGWILNAIYADRSLMRDALALGWFREMGRYAPRTRFVELFLHRGVGPLSRADYHGVYLLTERIEAGSNRVDLGSAAAPGQDAPEQAGYLFARDKVDPGDTTVTTAAGQELVVKAPDRAAISPRQLGFLRDTLDALEEALAAAPGLARQAELRRLLDVGCFVDFQILNELTRNADAFKWSTWFHRPAGGRICAGPPWDFEISLRNDRVAVDPTGWQTRFPRPQRLSWAASVMADPDLRESWAERWQELRRGPLATARLRADIEALRRELAEAQARNFARWPVLGASLPSSPDAPLTWDEEVMNLESWLELRLAWLDQQWPPAPTLRAVAGDRVAVESGEATVWLTRDGSDPRAPGGGPAAGATRVDLHPEELQLLQGVAAAVDGGRRWTVAIPSGLAELRLVTRAPPGQAFTVQLNGAPVLEFRGLPIREPHRELGSAVDAQGQLWLTTLLDLERTAGTVSLEARVDGSAGAMPEVELVGVRHAAVVVPLRPGERPSARAWREPDWSAIVRLPPDPK